MASSLASAPSRRSSVRWLRPDLQSSPRVLREGVLLDHLAADQMLLDDLFEHFGRAGMIPNSLRVNDRDRTMNAHPQAIDFASMDQWLGPGQVEFFKPLLQIFPGGQRLLAGRTVRLGLIGAKENVALVAAQPKGLCCFFQFFGWVFF